MLQTVRHSRRVSTRSASSNTSRAERGWTSPPVCSTWLGHASATDGSSPCISGTYAPLGARTVRNIGVYVVAGLSGTPFDGSEETHANVYRAEIVSCF